MANIDVPVIKNVEELVTPYLNGSKISSYKSKYLTKPGEHYGSCMLSLSVNTVDENGKEETIEMVAKMPPLSEFYFKAFCPERSFRSENSIYLDVVPALEDLEKELNVSEEHSFSRIFPKCFGARVNCDKDVGPVTMDALLVQENLVIAGFKPGDRTKFFGLETSEFILRNLAKFHAASIVLRILKPEVFQKFRKNFNKFDVMSNMGEEFNNDFHGQMYNDIHRATNDDEELIKKYTEYNEKSILSNTDGIEYEGGLYAAICHYDFWINNMMLKYDEKTSKPVDIKVVDFQIAQFNSAARDVLFFLFSSVDTDVLNNSYKHLLKVYFDSLVEILKVYGCPTTEYTFESFLDEMKAIAPLELPHANSMLKIIMAHVKVENDDFSKIDENMFNDENANLYGEHFYKRLLNNFELFKKLGYF